jgi:hypothetical protein
MIQTLTLDLSTIQDNCTKPIDNFRPGIQNGPVAIDLSRNSKFAGDDMQAIREAFPGIQSFSACDVSISEWSFRALASFENLEHIRLSDASYKGVSRTNFRCGLRLKSLHLENTGWLPSFMDFNDLSSLEYLNLSGTRSQAMLKFLESVPCFPSLRSLKLDSINTGHRLLQRLSEMEQLQVLSMHNASLFESITTMGSSTTIFHSMIQSLPNLTTLVLASCNFVTDSHLAGIHSASKLEILDLSNCLNMTRIGLESVSKLASLKHLCVANNRESVTDSWVISFAKSHPNLQSFNGSWCALGDRSIIVLATNCTSLKALKLNGCKLITTHSMQHLIPLLHLQSLELLGAHNAFNAEIMQTLQNRQVDIKYIPRPRGSNIVDQSYSDRFRCDCGRLIHIHEMQDHRSICSDILVRCPNSDEGCNQMVSRKSLSLHLECCKFYIISCMICSQSVTRLQWHDHMRTHHGINDSRPLCTASLEESRRCSRDKTSGRIAMQLRSIRPTVDKSEFKMMYICPECNERILQNNAVVHQCRMQEPWIYAEAG